MLGIEQSGNFKNLGRAILLGNKQSNQRLLDGERTTVNNIKDDKFIVYGIQ
jgi:hypothetical protein